MMRQSLDRKEYSLKSCLTSAPLCLCVSLTILFAAIEVVASENWPQWRGPSANGVSDSTELPTTWNLETNQNILWKAPLPSWSGSTPIIWGDHIFVMSPSPQQTTTAA